MKIDIQPSSVITVQSDIYIAGYNEDGSEHDGKVYYVQVEMPSGKRWRHSVKFHGVANEMGRFFDVSKSALNAATILSDRVVKRGYIDDSLWVETDPKYGSKEWAKRLFDYS